ncbi:MAG: hypothetical protein BGO41_13500 [Clostridiales bacterium 38-18]|nr:MAG: hypothetical protein BGO41_13500 [Clostridiales bacterium 38-18]
MIVSEIVEQLKIEILEASLGDDEDALNRFLNHRVDLETQLGVHEKKSLLQCLKQDLFGYGIIQPLLDHPEVTEIMINGLNSIFYESNGLLHLSEINFHTHDQLMQLIYKVANEVGREVNLTHPTLDARLKDGSRVNVVLDPIALNGPIVTIRKFKKALIRTQDLIDNEMFDSEIALFMSKIIKSKYNLFVCGSTGSGKTTLLNCLSDYIPTYERIITIEDAAELKLLNHKNLVSLETRLSKNEASVSTSHLIKNALRMRPDRIIVGEVRGEEIIDMLQAMNTGHDGSLSTGHSNSALDMLVRLEVIACSHSEVNASLIRRQIISAIDFIIFVEKLPDGKRCVTEICELLKIPDDYSINVLYTLSDFNRIKCDDLLSTIVNNTKLRRYQEYDKSN